MPCQLLPCPDCGKTDRLVPAERKRTATDGVAAAFTGAVGVGATETDLKAWTRCERCGTLIRQRRGWWSDLFARVFFGSKAVPGTVIRPSGS